MLSFFDCDVGVGRTGLSYPATETPAALLERMRRYGIDSALVYDRGAHESGVFDGFDFILDFCRHNPGLHPAIPVVPPATGEQPPPDEQIDIILELGIRAVRACPNAHGFDFDTFSMGPLLAALEQHRIPVIHSSMHMQDHPWRHAPAWGNLREVALVFPKLPILVVYTGMLQGRRLMPLLAECPNVLADLTCAAFGYVEYVVERFGSRKLVLASHYPAEDPALYTTWLNYADLSARARQDIASGNMLRLMEGIR